MASRRSLRVRGGRRHASPGAPFDGKAPLLPAAADESVPPPPPWTTLAALSLVYVSNQWSRSLVFYLVSFSAAGGSREFMNVDLGFGSAEYAVLASFGFTLLFAASSLVAGRVADRRDRAALTSAACAVWGLATVATAAAPSYAAVFALRVVQGVAMGFTTPAAYGLLADAFPRGSQATANSLYASGVYLGGGLASLSALLVASLGWRSTCIVVGCVALAAAALSFAVVRDPRTAEREAAAAAAAAERAAAAEAPHTGEGPAAAGYGEGPEREESLLAAVGAILSEEAVALLFAACALRFCAGFGIGVWSAPFFREAFPSDQATYAYLNAAVVAVGGFLSSLVGGKAADAFATKWARGDAGAKAWVVAASSALAAPAWLLVVRTGATFEGAMAALFAEYLVAECWFGPTIAMLYSCVDPARRGTAQGLFSVLTTVGNVAPVAIGLAVSHSVVALPTALALSVPAFYLGSAALFIATGFALRRREEAGYIGGGGGGGGPGRKE